MLKSLTRMSPTSTKEELRLPETQKALLVWDAFRAQSTDNVMRELETLNIKVVTIPKNRAHLLQPLDLTLTNAPVKKVKKNGFSDNFTSTVTETLDKGPHRDVATIEVDLNGFYH